MPLLTLYGGLQVKKTAYFHALIIANHDGYTMFCGLPREGCGNVFHRHQKSCFGHLGCDARIMRGENYIF